MAKINKICLIVHPMFSIAVELKDRKGPDAEKFLNRALSLYGRAYGLEMVNAAKDPHTAVVMVSFTEEFRKMTRKRIGKMMEGVLEKIISRLERLEAFGKKRLGKRFMVSPFGVVSPKGRFYADMGAFQRLPFDLAKKVEIHPMGEFKEKCLKDCLQAISDGLHYRGIDTIKREPSKVTVRWETMLSKASSPSGDLLQKARVKARERRIKRQKKRRKKLKAKKRLK